MPKRRTPHIAARKEPQQARSTELVAAILEAAVQVLATQGARHFTTARVAERAGVSVGSIYQYFPNKAAILFRLQTDEWHQTTTLLSSILNNRKNPPLARLRTLVHAFIRSECDEAAMRVALNDAAPLYRDAPEATEARAASDIAIQAFIEEVVPKASKQTQRTAAELLKTTLSAGGKDFSESPRTAAEIKVYSDAMADMFVAYLQSLGRKSKRV